MTTPIEPQPPEWAIQAAKEIAAHILPQLTASVAGVIARDCVLFAGLIHRHAPAQGVNERLLKALKGMSELCDNYFEPSDFVCARDREIWQDHLEAIAAAESAPAHPSLERDAIEALRELVKVVCESEQYATPGDCDAANAVLARYDAERKPE